MSETKPCWKSPGGWYCYAHGKPWPCSSASPPTVTDPAKSDLHALLDERFEEIRSLRQQLAKLEGCVSRDFATHGGDTLHTDIWYPRVPQEPGERQRFKYVTVGLIDVRASDDVRISYSHERNGWVIEQAQRFTWRADDQTCDPCWREVAFVESWASEDADWQRFVCGDEEP